MRGNSCVFSRSEDRYDATLCYLRTESLDVDHMTKRPNSMQDEDSLPLPALFSLNQLSFGISMALRTYLPLWLRSALV